MTGMKLITCLCCIFLQLIFVVSEISWENCDDDNSNGIKLLNVTVKPYPIIAPGSVSIEIAIRNTEDVVSPLKANLILSKKILFGYVSVPCVSGIGSCTYDDLCATCPQCGCPLKAGEHVLTLPITIDIGSWALVGNYQAEVNVKTSSGQKGCVKVSNVHIQSSK